MFFNPIQDGGGRGWGWGKKASATSFSPVTSTNVRISLKTFWLLVLTLLTDWCKISSLYLVQVPDYWTWTKTRSRSDYWTWTNCATLHHCRICVTDFREGGLFWPPHPWAAPKKPILNRVKRFILGFSMHVLWNGSSLNYFMTSKSFWLVLIFFWTAILMTYKKSLI